jgi:predicted nucleic acid-binding protein
VRRSLKANRVARQVEALLRRLEIVPMAGGAIAVAAARNFRAFRQRGITIRKTIDLLIGTWCIENRRSLLHNDSNFRPMARHLGLIEAPMTA